MNKKNETYQVKRALTKYHECNSIQMKCPEQENLWIHRVDKQWLGLGSAVGYRER